MLFVSHSSFTDCRGSWRSFCGILAGIRVLVKRAKRRVSLLVTPSILRHLRSFWENDPHNSDFIILRGSQPAEFFFRVPPFERDYSFYLEGL